MSAHIEEAAADYRLGRTVAPTRYELTFVPDLESGTFTGRGSIELELFEASTQIECHAAEIEITDATIRRAPGASSTGNGAEGGEVLALDVKLRPGDERVVFTAHRDLAPGTYVLSCAFSAPLNDRLHGFYRCRFEDPDGNEHLMAVTHFESQDARRAFPCFDEPDRKAVFSVTLEVAEDLYAISNSSVAETVDLGAGRKRVRFADTPVMSTYLVCFAVGPLESSEHVQAAGVPVGVVTPIGKLHLAGYALEVAKHALDWFASYFDLPYPGDKLDLLDVPDFAMGAMENLGCVTFRETDLLCDPEESSIPEIFKIAEVIEHELAHMWFGDLVTMKWWNDIWLNEAFATFMSRLCLDDFRPGWHCWVAFGREKDASLGIDALHSTRPIEFPVRAADEAEAMFDALTYLKGGNVLRMLEQWLGHDRFRDGVRRYLREHQFSNTEAADLWSAIAAGAAGAPVVEMMDSWIRQGGFPLVTARRRDGEIELSTEPFSYLTAAEWAEEGTGEPSGIGSRWLVPVRVARRPGGAPAEDDGGPGVETVLLGSEGEARVRIAEGGGLTVLNAGGSGVYRVRYEGELLGELLDNLDRLTPLERFNVVADTWAAALARRGPIEDFFSLTRHLKGENDPTVWGVVSGATGLLDFAIAEPDRPLLAEYLRSVFRPELERVGWDPTDGETAEIARSRAIFITTLGTFGEDAAVLERSRELFGAAAASRGRLPGGTAEAILRVIGGSADRGAFEAMLKRVRRPLDPLDGERHLFALTGVGEPELVSELQDLCRTEVKAQDGPYVLRGLLANRLAGPSTWRFVDSRWDELKQRFPSHAMPEMIGGLSRLAQLGENGEPLMVAEVRADLARRDFGGHKRRVDQHLERLAVNVAFVREHRPRLGEILARV